MRYVLPPVYPNDPLATFQTGQQLYYAYDPSYWREDYQWYLKNTGQSSPLFLNGVLQSTDAGGASDIQAESAWRIRTEGTILMALIDTGITTNHPDLIANHIRGENFTLRSTDLSPENLQDTDGHGTHMAGVIAATGNNGFGVSGICWKANLLVCKTRMAYDGLGYDEVVHALDYAISNNAKIIYLPWGGANQDVGLSNAMARVLAAGILVVTAAPNNSADLDTFSDYPICWRLENVIAVTSLTRSDALYAGGFGKTTVHLGAPGRVLATTSMDTNYPYAYDSGTSAAAAVVAGAAGLVWSQYPNQDWRSIKFRLLSTVVPVSMLEARSITGGRLNLAGAITPETIILKPFHDRIMVMGLMRDSRYEMQTSSNLTDWTTERTFTAGTGDYLFSPVIEGFYRIKLQ